MNSSIPPENVIGSAEQTQNKTKQIKYDRGAYMRILTVEERTEGSLQIKHCPHVIRAEGYKEI